MLSRLSVRVFLITFLTLFLVLVGMYAAMEVALYLQVRWWPVRLAEFRRTVAELQPFAIGGGLVVSAVGAAVFARVISAPVAGLSKMSRRIAAMDLTARIEVTRTDELGDLGHDLNTLASRLHTSLRALQAANAQLRSDVEREQEVKRQRTALFTTIAHELKTPLTVLRGELSGMIDGVGPYQDRDAYLRHALETTAGMERLVHSALLLARLESADGVTQRAPVDLGALVARQCAGLEDMALQRGIDIVCFAPPGQVVEGDALQLDFAVSNVVSNAVKHSAPGEVVEVELRPGPGTVTLAVVNTGSIADVDAARLAADAGTTGARFASSGFGLSIVRRILLAHDVDFAIRDDGDQVVFTAVFPVVGRGAAATG